MPSVALYVKMEAKPEKVDEVASFLKSALPLVNQEPDTVSWYAIRLGPTTFSIFDTFEGDEGRQAHLNGQVAAALMGKVDELLTGPPEIHQVDLVAAKVG